jgi:hypothetical protein
MVTELHLLSMDTGTMSGFSTTGLHVFYPTHVFVSCWRLRLLHTTFIPALVFSLQCLNSSLLPDMFDACIYTSLLHNPLAPA